MRSRLPAWRLWGSKCFQPLGDVLSIAAGSNAELDVETQQLKGGSLSGLHAKRRCGRSRRPCSRHLPVRRRQSPRRLLKNGVSSAFNTRPCTFAATSEARTPAARVRRIIPQCPRRPFRTCGMQRYSSAAAARSASIRKSATFNMPTWPFAIRLSMRNLPLTIKVGVPVIR